MIYEFIVNYDNQDIPCQVMSEVDIMVASFERLNQTYDWYLSEHVMGDYDVISLSDDELDIILEDYLREVGVWDVE